MGRKKKKQVKPGAPGSKAHREFFTGGLSRKGHAIPPKTTYDRRKLKEDLEKRQSNTEDSDSKDGK